MHSLNVKKGVDTRLVGEEFLDLHFFPESIFLSLGNACKTSRIDSAPVSKMDGLHTHVPRRKKRSHNVFAFVRGGVG